MIYFKQAKLKTESPRALGVPGFFITFDHKLLKPSTTMKKIFRILQTGTMLRAFLTFVFFMSCAIVFGQNINDSTVATPQDPTNDVFDWIARILACIGILVPGWDIYKAGARERASRAQIFFTRFVEMVDNNELSNTAALRDLASRGRDVVKKDGPSNP